MFKSLFGRSQGKVPQTKLPQLHSFVDVTVAGRPMRSVSVEELTPKEIAVSTMLGRAGENAVFIYTNENGKFRFSTKVAASREGVTRFELPDRVESLGGGTAAGQKRSSVRMDVLVSGYWRFAPGGKGVGDFVRCNIRDISRGGCALIADRAFKLGQMIEVKMALRQDAAPLETLGEVMRCEQIPTSGKYSHGLRFHGLRPDEDQAILEFINRRQAELRNRGLA
jgi:c-di-GMP-binding flagellar brake protein YcgR